MNLIEAFAMGHRRRCDCKDISFVLIKKMKYYRIPVFTQKRNPSLLEQAIPVKYKEKHEIRYYAHCSQCHKLYFTGSRSFLTENFKKLNIKYKLLKGD